MLILRGKQKMSKKKEKTNIGRTKKKKEKTSLKGNSILRYHIRVQL